MVMYVTKKHSSVKYPKDGNPTISTSLAMWIPLRNIEADMNGIAAYNEGSQVVLEKFYGEINMDPIDDVVITPFLIWQVTLPVQLRTSSSDTATGNLLDMLDTAVGNENHGWKQIGRSELIPAGNANDKTTKYAYTFPRKTRELRVIGKSDANVSGPGKVSQFGFLLQRKVATDRASPLDVTNHMTYVVSFLSPTMSSDF